MASSGNFCTMNPLALVAGGTLSNGNLQLSSSANADYHCDGTMGVNPNDTQGYYFEVRLVSRITNMAVGLGRNVYWTGSYGSGNNQSYVMAVGSRSAETGAGDVYTLTSVNTSFRQTFADGDIIGIAVKGGKIWFAKNNTYINSGNPAGDSGEAISGATGTLLPIWSHGGGSGTNTQYFNFGQDDTFGGAITGEGNTDENGFGVFKYAPPTGFLALCSANLPISADIDPAQTDDDYPGKQFNTVLYTGNSTTGQALTGLGFKPDLIWAKMRSSSQNNQLFDSSRMNTRGTPTPFMLRSDDTGAEIDDQAQGNNNPMIASFDTDGFTLGTSGSGPNDNGRTYVAWCWRANGGVTSSNSDGSITTTLQVGKGFSIGTYTGTGSNATVGHGLGAVPDFTLFKRRDASGNWVATSQKNMASNDHNLYLQLSNAESDGNYFQNTAIMYNWINVEGYQKFGKYEGNGNADGPFVYTGFRPRMMFVKSIDSSDDWIVIDTARSTFNVTNAGLSWNLSNAETTSNRECDILSNGFKPRTSNTNLNKSSTTYIYGAWGDVPFKYNNTF